MHGELQHIDDEGYEHAHGEAAQYAQEEGLNPPRSAYAAHLQEDGLEEETYTIVGAAEANPREGKISNESPMGKAILNHRAGEDVQVETPNGSYTIHIVKIG